MLCKNCGRQVEDGVNFCPGCGVAVQTAEAVNQTAPNTVELSSEEGVISQNIETAANSGEIVFVPPVYNYTKPRKSKKPFVFLGVGVVAIAVIAVIVLQLLLAGNPIAQTLVAVSKLNGMTGANISVDVDYKDSRSSYSFGGDMAFKLGEDLESSVLDASVSMYGEKVRVVYSDGDIGGESGGEYIFFSNVIDTLQELVDEALEDADIDLSIDVNNLVKDGAINAEYIRELYEDADLEALYGSDYDEDMAEGMQQIIYDFVLKECGKKDVQAKFLSGYKKSGSTYEYTVDVAGAALAFIDYLEACENSSNRNVSDAAEQLLNQINVGAARSNLENMEGKYTAYVSYSTVSGRLSQLNVDIETEDDEKISFSLSIDNYNKPNIDMDDVEVFLKDAKDNSYSFW